MSARASAAGDSPDVKHVPAAAAATPGPGSPEEARVCLFMTALRERFLYGLDFLEREAKADGVPFNEGAAKAALQKEYKEMYSRPEVNRLAPRPWATDNDKAVLVVARGGFPPDATFKQRIATTAKEVFGSDDETFVKRAYDLDMAEDEERKKLEAPSLGRPGPGSSAASAIPIEDDENEEPLRRSVILSETIDLIEAKKKIDSLLDENAKLSSDLFLCGADLANEKAKVGTLNAQVASLTAALGSSGSGAAAAVNAALEKTRADVASKTKAIANLETELKREKAKVADFGAGLKAAQDAYNNLQAEAKAAELTAKENHKTEMNKIKETFDRVAQALTYVVNAGIDERVTATGEKVTADLLIDKATRAREAVVKMKADIETLKKAKESDAKAKSSGESSLRTQNATLAADVEKLKSALNMVIGAAKRGWSANEDGAAKTAALIKTLRTVVLLHGERITESMLDDSGKISGAFAEDHNEMMAKAREEAKLAAAVAPGLRPPATPVREAIAGKPAAAGSSSAAPAAVSPPSLPLGPSPAPAPTAALAADAASPSSLLSSAGPSAGAASDKKTTGNPPVFSITPASTADEMRHTVLGSGQTLIVRESKGAIKVEWQLQSGTLIQPKTDGMSVVGVGASTDVRADTVKLNFSPTLVPIIKETLAKTLGELVDIGQKQKPGIAGFAERIKTGSHALVALTDEKGGVGTYSENASGSQFIMRTTPMAAFFGLFLQAQNLLVSSAPEIKTAIGADAELQACLQSMSNVANAWKTLAPGEFTALQSKYCNIGIAVTRSFALFLSPSLRASVSYALIGMVQKILQSSKRDDVNDGIHLSIRDVLLNPNRLNGIKLLCNVAADAEAIDSTKDDRKGFFANTPVSGVGRQPSKK